MFPSHLIDPSRPVLVALSGGADSVSLLHILLRRGYHCVAAHCNFHLRGDESDSDEAFVRDLCDSLHVQLLVAQFDTIAYAQERHLSIEMAARDLRYDWFFSILDNQHIPVVAVAHHADDDAETTLLNLTRGTGLRGLTGMKERNGRVVRPLLDMSRADIEDYCRANHLQYVTDRTNASDDYARNRIRHHVIPALKSINPSLLPTMRANARHAQAVYDIFNAALTDFVSHHVSCAPDGSTHVDADALRRQPSPEPFLFEILSPLGFSPAQADDAARCVSLSQSGRTFLSSSHRAVVDRAEVIILPLSASASAEALIPSPTDDVELLSPAHVRLRHFPIPDAFKVSRDPRVIHLDADRVTYPLTLRHWRRGDAFRPLGMRGEKKLSDFFVDAKMSIPQKEATTILTSASGQILCLVGLRPDDRAKVTPATRNILEVALLD